jgi:hypothetical protein
VQPRLIYRWCQQKEAQESKKDKPSIVELDFLYAGLQFQDELDGMV